MAITPSLSVFISKLMPISTARFPAVFQGNGANSSTPCHLGFHIARTKDITKCGCSYTSKLSQLLTWSLLFHCLADEQLIFPPSQYLDLLSTCSHLPYIYYSLRLPSISPPRTFTRKDNPRRLLNSSLEFQPLILNISMSLHPLQICRVVSFSSQDKISPSKCIGRFL